MKSLNTSLFHNYKDLDLCMKIHPLYSDVVPLVELDAIKNSIKNILMTRPGERPFQPDFGCNLVDFLFEPMDVLTINAIQDTIEFAINRFEPRVSLKSLDVVANPNRNHYEISIVAEIINQRKNVDISLVLERLR